MNHGEVKKAADCRRRAMDADAVGVSSLKSMRGTIASRIEVAARCPRTAWSKCERERGFVAGSEAHGGPWLDKPQQSARSSPRTDRPRPAASNPPRVTARLQPVCHHTLPAGLRPQEDRGKARLLPPVRLHGQRRGAGNSTDRGCRGPLAAPAKIETSRSFCSPAPGQSIDQTSRHGTKGREVSE